MDQQDISRALDRIGNRGVARSYDLPPVVNPTLSTLDVVPREVIADEDLNTAAGGRTAALTTPDNELRIVHAIATRNVNTAVTHRHQVRPRSGEQVQEVLPLGAAVAANVWAVTNLAQSIPLWPGGEIRVVFGAGALNDDTKVTALCTRLPL